MAHIGQKLTFGPVSAFGRLLGCLQLALHLPAGIGSPVQGTGKQVDLARGGVELEFIPQSARLATFLQMRGEIGQRTCNRARSHY